MIGKIYGSYRILGPLGEGGMGVVYEAEHVQVGRRAAIKVLLPEWSNNEVIVERFFNEARSSVMANHPGIVEIFDCGWSDEGKAYLVMELLEGQPLSELLAAEGPLPVHRMTSMARQTAAALAAAHDKGIVHRDLKPENIFVIPDQYAQGGERIKVLDFGVAKLAIARREQAVAGVMLGTPLYMAPEQCLSSAEVDGRGDVYSLGCIMFEMVCGRPPFVDDDPMTVAAMQVKEPPPRPRSLRPDLPPSVESLILRTLAKNREARPQSMTDLRSELDVVWSLMRPDGEPSRELPAISPGVPVIKVAATTMRGAAAEVSRPNASDKGSHEAGQTASKAGAWPGHGDLRKRLPVRAALGVAVAAAVALGSFVFMGGGHRPSDRGTGSDRLETTGTPVDARPEPSLIIVHLDSSPPGARVYLAGEQVGITPLKRAFPRSNEPMRFRLEQDGYQPRLIDIAGEHDQSTTILLEPLPR